MSNNRQLSENNNDSDYSIENSYLDSESNNFDNQNYIQS